MAHPLFLSIIINIKHNIQNEDDSQEVKMTWRSGGLWCLWKRWCSIAGGNWEALSCWRKTLKAKLMETLFSVRGRVVNKSEKAPLSLLCESFPSQGFLFVLGCSSSLPFSPCLPSPARFSQVHGSKEASKAFDVENGYEARNDSWIYKLSSQGEPVSMQQVATSSKPSPAHVCVFPLHFPPSISSHFFMIISPLPFLT